MTYLLENKEIILTEIFSLAADGFYSTGGATEDGSLWILMIYGSTLGHNLHKHHSPIYTRSLYVYCTDTGKYGSVGIH